LEGRKLENREGGEWRVRDDWEGGNGKKGRGESGGKGGRGERRGEGREGGEEGEGVEEWKRVAWVVYRYGDVNRQEGGSSVERKDESEEKGREGRD